jgi:hypothetical protein
MRVQNRVIHCRFSDSRVRKLLTNFRVEKSATDGRRLAFSYAPPPLLLLYLFCAPEESFCCICCICCNIPRLFRPRRSTVLSIWFFRNIFFNTPVSAEKFARYFRSKDAVADRIGHQGAQLRFNGIGFQDLKLLNR